MKIQDILNKSLEFFEDKLQLKNDEDVPGNSKYYGTDETGTKGFHVLPEGGGASYPSFVDNKDKVLTVSTTEDDVEFKGIQDAKIDIVMPTLQGPVLVGSSSLNELHQLKMMDESSNMQTIWNKVACFFHDPFLSQALPENFSVEKATVPTDPDLIVLAVTPEISSSAFSMTSRDVSEYNYLRIELDSATGLSTDCVVVVEVKDLYSNILAQEMFDSDAAFPHAVSVQIPNDVSEVDILIQLAYNPAVTTTATVKISYIYLESSYNKRTKGTHLDDVNDLFTATDLEGALVELADRITALETP